MAVVVPLWAAMCAGGTAAAAAVLALSPRRSPARPEAPVLAEEEAPPPPDAPESDNESDGSADERDGVADEGDDRGRKGMKRFSIDERWLQRCDRKVIGADLAEGCGCPKQCTDQLTVAMVEEERKSEGKKGGVLRRSELRLYLESNRTAATKLGFKLHPEHHDSILLCPGAFDILKGYGYGYTYKFVREVKAGIGQDDHHGGDGGANDGFGEDSLQKMVSRQSDWMQCLALDHVVMVRTIMVHVSNACRRPSLDGGRISVKRPSSCPTRIFVNSTLSRRRTFTPSASLIYWRVARTSLTSARSSFGSKSGRRTVVM